MCNTLEPLLKSKSSHAARRVPTFLYLDNSFVLNNLNCYTFTPFGGIRLDFFRYLCRDKIKTITYTYMIRNIIKLTLAGLLLTSIPVTAMAEPSVEIIENDFQNVTITVEESSVIHVTGANGEMLYVYNVAGVRVKSVKVDGDDKRFEMNLPKGCYILKVGKTVRKVSIR